MRVASIYFALFVITEANREMLVEDPFVLQVPAYFNWVVYKLIDHLNCRFFTNGAKQMLSRCKLKPGITFHNANCEIKRQLSRD